MFRKTVALGKAEQFNPKAHICTESYYFLGVLLYRRDRLVIAP